MKTRSTIAISILAGAVLGGAAIQALHAQAKPPVYMIAINESATRRATRKTTFRLLRNRSKITAASMSRQDRERGSRATSLTGRS